MFILRNQMAVAQSQAPPVLSIIEDAVRKRRALLWGGFCYLQQFIFRLLKCAFFIKGDDSRWWGVFASS